MNDLCGISSNSSPRRTATQKRRKSIEETDTPTIESVGLVEETTTGAACDVPL